MSGAPMNTCVFELRVEQVNELNSSVGSVGRPQQEQAIDWVLLMLALPVQ